MPKLVVELNDNYMAMSRALHIHIARRVAELANLPDDTQVRFLGHSLALTMPGSTLDEHTAENRLPGNQRITIEVSEEDDEDFALSTAVNRLDTMPFFKEPNLKVTLRPVYQRIKATMSVRLTGADYTTVSSWISTMKRRLSQELTLHVHSVNYHYHIPAVHMAILFELYRLREAQYGYGDTIGEWLRAGFSPKMDVIANQAGKRTQFVIRESQGEIVGYYDFMAQRPKQESENSGGAWSVAFTYTYSFDRVDSVVMTYPLVVHNQMLTEKFRDGRKPFEVSDVIQKATANYQPLRHFGYRYRGSEAWIGTPGVPIPPFDDWLPPPDTVLPNTTNMIRMLVQLDPTNLNALVSLTAMGEWVLPDEVLDYLRSNPTSLLEPYNGLFFLSLYEGDTLLDTRQLIVSPNLDITYGTPLNPRKVYHLCMWMVSNPLKLSESAVQQLVNYPDLTRAVLTAYDTSIETAVYYNEQFYGDGRIVGKPTGVVLSTSLNGSTGLPNIYPYVAGDNTVQVSPSPVVPLTTAGRLPNPASTNLPDLANTQALVGQLPTGAGNQLDVKPSPTRVTENVPNTTPSIPVLPQIQADGTLLYSDLLLALDYIQTHNVAARLESMPGQQWNLIGNVLIHSHLGE